MNRLITAVSMVLVVAANSHAELKARPGASDTNKKTATEFVSGYYQHLRAGMNREQLGEYWSKDMASFLDKTVAVVADATKSGAEHETRNFLDLMLTTAKCERLTLIDSSIYNVLPVTSMLKFKVEPLCTEWSNVTAREVRLRHSYDLNGWVITGITDEVQYK